MKKVKIDNNEPVIDSNNYQISLGKALNVYNEEWDKDKYKNATIEYALSINIELPKCIPDIEFRNIGAICRLLTRNQFIDINHYNYVIKRLNELKEYKKEVKEETVKVVEPRKEIVIPFFEEIENFIDTFILNGKNDIKKLISKYNSIGYSSTESKKVETFVVKNINMLNGHIGNWDDDIKQSYSPRTKNDIKGLVSLLEEFKATIVKLVPTKTKVKKEKPASIQVKEMPYLKTYENINSLHPKTLIGKSFAIIYDIEYRDIIILCSIASKFNASGMTYGNLDLAKCKKKKLRKPEEQLKELLTKKTKKEIIEYFDNIKTTEQKAVGRMSENKIIIGVY